MAEDLWPKIHAERNATADFVAGLSDAQLATPSSCEGWAVRDVIGHMIATGHTSVGAFFGGMISSGFKFDRFADKQLNKWNTGSGPELAERLRAIATGKKAPPGPTVTWLGEAIVHAEDIRRPLGARTTYPMDHLVPVADFYKGSNLLIGAKKRIDGFTLRATDIDWSTGSGPEVNGPCADLISAMTGRKDALRDLGGDGLQQFSARF